MQRVPTVELLDSDDGSGAEVSASLKDLRRINRWFGGITTTHDLVLAVARRTGQKQFTMLEVAAGTELGAPRVNIHGYFGALYPVYVRGLAYLATHRGLEAAAEFQKVLDHRGIVVTDSIGALARLQLGRAFTLAGSPAKAKAAYQELLALWNDADGDIPVLKQAQTEYGRL